MNRHYWTSMYGAENSAVMYCYIVDDYGCEWEVAGSYYKEHPEAPMLHKQMRIVNADGALFHLENTIATS